MDKPPKLPMAPQMPPYIPPVTIEVNKVDLESLINLLKSMEHIEVEYDINHLAMANMAVTRMRGRVIVAIGELNKMLTER